MSYFDPGPQLRERAIRLVEAVVPASVNNAWLTRWVDEPRFGWDTEALDTGFFGPVHDYVRMHATGLQATLAEALAEALRAGSQVPDLLLAALEIQHLAASMLDNLTDGTTLARFDKSLSVPPPVWVTVAYNLRQFAVVLGYDGAAALGPRGSRLGELFGCHLATLGASRIIDIGSPPLGQDELREHLRTTEPAATYDLAAAVAGAAAGLNDAQTVLLRRAGRSLGAHLRWMALADAENDSTSVRGNLSKEPATPLPLGLTRDDMLRLASEELVAAIHSAKTVDPAAAEVVLAWRADTRTVDS